MAESVLKQVAPDVSKAFYQLTDQVRASTPFDPKTISLILIGIFTSDRSYPGLHTHITRAVNAGASKEEIYGAILLALPIIGSPAVNRALETAQATLKELGIEA